MERLGLGLYRKTTSEVCWVIEEWRMDRMPNAEIRKMCGVTKRVYERIDESACYLMVRLYRKSGG